MEDKNTKRFCEFLRTHLPGWKNVQDDQMSYHLFSSITNKVYKVTASQPDVSPNPVILRNFCGHEGIVDKDKETKVFAGMSKGGFGPECYGHDGDIRLEQFIPSRTIFPHEYKERIVRRKLARTLAAINKIDIQDIDRTSMFEGILNDPVYFKQFDDKCDQDIYSPEEKELIQQLRVVSSQQERDFLRSIIPLDDVVFSHNDLLQGNVLITTTDDVMFIDYEYAAYNFRGYDIGNMFKEATFDYAVKERPYFRIVQENFPKEEELKDFLRYYIGFTDMSLKEQKEHTEELLNNDELMKAFLYKKYKPEELEKKVDDLYRKTMIGVMLSHYYWLVWGIKMHKTVDIQFDYLDFAQYKFEQYQKLKKELFNQ